MIKSHTGDFYEVGIRYGKTQEDGQTKSVTEKYCIDALSFGEAEETAIKEMEAYISGDYKLTSNSLASYHEAVTSETSNAERYYKVKAAFITMDEKTGKEKRSNVNFLVQGSTLRNALDNFDEFMKPSITDYTVVSVQETKLVDVFFHEEKKPKQQADESGGKATAD